MVFTSSLLSKWLVRSGSVLAISTGIAVVAGAEQSSPQPDRPPNIVFLMTDQQCWDAMGCAGNRMIKTPNLDKLANQGARITQAVCAMPFCTPTRATWRTGLWPHTHGQVSNMSEGQRAARPSARRRAIADTPEAFKTRPTFDQILADRGYALEHLGKWHLGIQRGLKPFRS